MTKSIRLIPFLFISFIFSCTTDSTTKPDSILNETFDRNEIGWTEEATDFHEVGIIKGKYLIHSKDSTHQSNGGPFYVDFLIGLPKSYEISTTAKYIDGLLDGEVGLILVSSSISYRFRFYSRGKVEVLLFDINSRTEKSICSTLGDNLKFKKGDELNIKISIKDRNFKLKLNEKNICDGKFQSGQWSDLKLLSGPTTKAEFDDLIVKEIK